jgi:hypothetical protein
VTQDYPAYDPPPPPQPEYHYSVWLVAALLGLIVLAGICHAVAQATALHTGG